MTNNSLRDIVTECDESTSTGYMRSLAECVTGEPEPVDYSSVTLMMFTENPRNHEKRNEAISVHITEMISGKIVLDLGCGVLGSGYRIAKFAKAKKYTGVEEYHAASTYKDTSAIASPEVPFEIFQQDMLYFVGDHAHSADIVFLVGIDEIVFPRYWPDLLENIYNRLSENGRVLIGGGWTKPWDWIDRYFEIDRTFLKIHEEEARAKRISSYADMFLPNVFKKKPGVESRWRGCL